jgi:hypothetical protein
MKNILSSLTAFSLLLASSQVKSAPVQQWQADIVKISTPTEKTNANRKENEYDLNKDTSSINDPVTPINPIEGRYKAAVQRLKQQAAILKEYAKNNQYNTDYCFLVDMSLPSGKNRFFVYNIKKDSVEYASLVAHGFGSYQGNGSDELVFSNIPNSYMTSLGKYKIGNSYHGAFGLAYKLFGLDNTNSNAYERAIVLHAYTSMPASETYPERICESAGCPMVNASFLTILGHYIKSSKKPLLLWIYN